MCRIVVSLFFWHILSFSVLGNTAERCADLFSPKSSPKNGATAAHHGFYFGRIEPKKISTPEIDYRTYIYPEMFVSDSSLRRLRNRDLESIGKNLETPYLYSILDLQTYSSEIAFFRARDGQVFGISHVELFNGNFSLIDAQYTRERLQLIEQTVIKKIMSPLLPGRFEASQSRAYHWNETNAPPFLKDPSLRLYKLSETGPALAIRSYESNGMHVQIMDVIGQRHLAGKKIHDNGRETASELLDEILDFVLPLYIERRGWPKAFTQELRKKAHETITSTKYIIVRDSQSQRIVGCIGLSRAPYGKAVFRNESDWNWIETTGAFGSTVDQDFSHSKIPETRRLDSPVPLLPMESYLGISPLPRPMTVELFTRGYRQQVESFGMVDGGMHIVPSAFDPFYAGSGIIFEPTKFAIARDLNTRGLTHTLVIKELFSAVFDLRYSKDALLQGQMLYTYNDEDGVRLYRTMGFEAMPATVKKDGVDWTLLRLTPQRLLEVFEKHAQQVARYSKEIAESFEAHVTAIRPTYGSSEK